MAVVTDIFSYMTLKFLLMRNILLLFSVKAQKIPKDNIRHSLFTLLPSGKRYRSIHCHTTGLLSSLSPQAVGLLNSPPTFHHKK